MWLCSECVSISDLGLKMRLLFLVSTLLFSSMAVSADRYICTPISGNEDFGHSNLYVVSRDGDRVRLVDANDKESYWDYDIFYSTAGYGVRAVRSIQEGSESLAKMASIAIGGTLYLMTFDGVKTDVLVTYANAAKTNDTGSMRLKCTK